MKQHNRQSMTNAQRPISMPNTPMSPTNAARVLFGAVSPTASVAASALISSSLPVLSSALQEDSSMSPKPIESQLRKHRPPQPFRFLTAHFLGQQRSRRHSCQNGGSNCKDSSAKFSFASLCVCLCVCVFSFDKAPFFSTHLYCIYTGIFQDLQEQVNRWEKEFTDIRVLWDEIQKMHGEYDERSQSDLVCFSRAQLLRLLSLSPSLSLSLIL